MTTALAVLATAALLVPLWLWLRHVQQANADREILHILRAEPDVAHYGFDLMDRARIGSGRLYVALAKLERDGWVRSSWGEAPPECTGELRRRVYQITEAGMRGLT